ncbi:putative serpin [Hirschfeldia incana]|nr:putative serpin [Hirschfeldia incana]
MDFRESLRKQNEIVLNLFKHVIATTTAGETLNLLFSPALLNVILSFIAAKSPGGIEEKILSLLQASSTDELNTVSSTIVTTVLADNTSSGGPTIAAANGAWLEKSVPVHPSFKDIIQNSYKAAFNLVDFRNKVDEVVEEVNSWVEKETKGLITNLIPENSVSPACNLIFANALFFNGRWDQEFDPSLTKDSDFHRLDGTTVRVPFMSASYSFGYDLVVVAYQGFKVLKLPYRGGRGDYSRSFSMQIYLPDEKDGLPAMLERLSSCRGFLSGHGDIPGHSAGIGELRIPRFKFEFGFEPTEALEGLGLELPGDAIIHKSCIEVDEVGSKAAAAAAVISLGGCFMPPKEKYDFVADHPFLFLVKENVSGLVLFLGQVTDPSMH